MVILVVGKKGAGKSHYAETLMKEKVEEGRKVVWFDGDQFRKLKNNQDFSDTGRIKNLINVAVEAEDWEEKGYLVICSFVAPRRKWRDMMRKYWMESRVVYMPGGTLWEGTTFETPTDNELQIKMEL